MNEEEIRELHKDLGFAFTKYAASPVEWPLLDQLPRGTTLVFQTDDPDYNAWELQLAARAGARDKQPDRPVTLIYVHVPNPPSVEGIDWSRAKVLGSFAIKAEYKEEAAPV